jgi:radical SAM protein with 4Fe4S-binding SPASM domain
MRLRRQAVVVATKIIPRFMMMKMMENRFGHMGIEPTNICNADCTFCGYSFLKKPKSTMTIDTFKRTVDDYASVGGGELSLTPTVGDPLVDGKILEKIAYARSIPQIRSIFLYTNGILLDKFGYEEVLTSGISRLAISTYMGSREGYKHYYGKDEYPRVVQNIIETLRKNLGLGEPVRITLHLRCEGDESIWKSTDEYAEIAPLVGDSNIFFMKEYDNWGGLIEPEDIPDGTVLQVPLSAEEKSKSPCFEMYRRVHVLVNGNVGVCVCRDMEGEINIGNIEHATIKEIWQGDKLKEYRSNWTKGILPQVCIECTRYESVDKYVGQHKTTLAVNFLKRQLTGR